MPDTDIKINYYLRQQKSIQRKMLCNLFNSINRIFDLHQYRYIGMGAKYFVDFLLFHREFGFQNMISIEADSENKEKYDFNKPLKCIDMHYGLSSEVLPNLDWTTSMRSIIWLDYDGYLEKFMLEDIETIISKLASGSIFFISFNSNWHKDKKRREQSFKDSLGNYCPNGLIQKDFTEKNKHSTQCRPINNTINNAVALRSDIKYSQLIDFVYKDGAEMTTIGGIILNDDDKKQFDTLDFTHLEFVNRIQNSDAFSLRIPPLTYKEAIRIFENLPCNDYSTINVPGLDSEHIAQIAKVYRYYPLFIEASVFT